MSNGCWACRACIEQAGCEPKSGPEYESLGYCGAGGHKATGLWWFPEGLATVVPPPTINQPAAPPAARRGSYGALEKAGQASFLDQL